MGTVYHATDIRLGRDAALKFPNDENLRDESQRELFEAEARAAAALNHPNICTIYGVGEQNHRPFLAMELLTGDTLETILRQRRPGVQEILSIATQVAAALDAAHAKGVIHRDIKPSNIFVTSGNLA